MSSLTSIRPLISSSITAQNNSREWCTSGDLFLLYCLLYKRLCALAHGLAQYFPSAYHRQEHGLLYNDTYVTVIALSFGFHPESDLILRPTIQMKRLGMNTLSRMKIIKKYPLGGKLFKGASAGSSCRSCC
ncbi:hypothetical protein Hanom_Chr12g01156791 [Helianthus anomalus]